MNGYISYTEVQSVVMDRLGNGKRQRVNLNVGRRRYFRELTVALMSFLF